MFYKILLSILIAGFISACSTTPKDTAEVSGSGSSGSSETVASTELTTGDASILADLNNTTLGGPSVEPGSQEDLIVNVGDRVYFSFNSAALDSDAQQLLHEQAAWLKQNYNTSITIEGHCDERGTREYNLALGEQRAQAVKNWFILLGVDSSRLSTISYGKERPAVIGSNEGAWSQNRRSVTTVVSLQ
jgi:peptidoglycan-associated lipoprotein